MNCRHNSDAGSFGIKICHLVNSSGELVRESKQRLRNVSRMLIKCTVSHNYGSDANPSQPVPEYYPTILRPQMIWNMRGFQLCPKNLGKRASESVLHCIIGGARTISKAIRDDMLLQCHAQRLNLTPSFSLFSLFFRPALALQRLATARSWIWKSTQPHREDELCSRQRRMKKLIERNHS